MHVFDPQDNWAMRGEPADEAPPRVQDLVIALVLAEQCERGTRGDTRRVCERVARSCALRRIVDRRGDDLIQRVVRAFADEDLAERRERTDLATGPATCAQQPHLAERVDEPLDQPSLSLARRA